MLHKRFCLGRLVWNYPGETVSIIGKNGAESRRFSRLLPECWHTSVSVVIMAKYPFLLVSFGKYTGLENVYLNGTIMGFQEKRWTRKWIKFSICWYWQFIHQPVKSYSAVCLRLAFQLRSMWAGNTHYWWSAFGWWYPFQAKCLKNFRT